jgi:hypothetical protein
VFRDRCRRLADIERARARLDGVARVTPSTARRRSRGCGRDGAAEGGEPPADGLVQDPRAVNKLATLGRPSARRASSRRAPATTRRRSRGRRARPGFPATIFVPQDAPMAKVEAAKSYGARRGDGR